MGLLAAGAAYGAPSHTAQRLSSLAGPDSSFQLRSDSRCYLAGRRSHAQRGCGGKKVDFRRETSARSPAGKRGCALKSLLPFLTGLELEDRQAARHLIRHKLAQILRLCALVQ